MDFGFQAFAAGSRKEIWRRIRLWGPNFLFLSSSVDILAKTMIGKKRYVPFIGGIFLHPYAMLSFN